MTPTETVAILRQFNEWRRGYYAPEEQPTQPDPVEISEAIDAAVEMIDRLEAAESDALEQARLNGMGSEREAALMAKLEAVEQERDALRAKIETAENDTAHQKALAASALRVIKGWERKCGELRAKIEAMEQQGPPRGWWDDLIADISAIDCMYRGSPTYAHDAYWMRDRVVWTLKQRRDSTPGVKGE